MGSSYLLCAENRIEMIRFLIALKKRVSYNKATNRKGELLDETINLR